MLIAITIDSLRFNRVPVQHQTADGAILRLVRVGMPKIPPTVRKCVFYLHVSLDDAKNGGRPGGTGFFLLHRDHNMNHLYAVTNWHVAKDDSDPEEPPFPVIRYVPADSEEPRFVDLRPSDWFSLEGHSDLAITPISYDRDDTLVGVPTSMLMPQKRIKSKEIDVGDDIFMMGLFADHDGGASVSPAARFGHISVMPSQSALVEQPNAGRGEAFVLDVHSRSGFSGSPVFVYRTFGSDLSFDAKHHLAGRVVDDEFSREKYVEISSNQETVFGLLGIHYAQFREEWEIGRRGAAEAKRLSLIADEQYVSGFSGMTCAVPAWKLLELLQMDELANIREHMAMQSKGKAKGPRPEKRPSNEPLTKDEIAERRDAAVRKALRTPPRPLKSLKKADDNAS